MIRLRGKEFTLPTFVRREKYLRVVRQLADARAAYYDEQAKSQQADQIIREQRTYITGLQQQVQAYQGQVTNIRAALLRLPVYQGLAGPVPLEMLVGELAQDHTRLEERIERVLDLILARRDMDGIDVDGEEYATLNTIVGLLQGQITNAPDTIEEIEDHD